jgi:hypothetical protein
MRGARGGKPFFRGLGQNAAQELRYTAYCVIRIGRSQAYFDF